MKKRMMKMRSIFLLSFFLVLFSTPMLAQGENPDEFEPGVDDEPAVPIDGYIYAGLIAGVLIAVKKLRKTEIA